MSELIQQCSNLLKNMYDEKEALFSFCTRQEAGRYLNDFTHPLRFRYTINVLAGIQRASQFHSIEWDLENVLDRFLALQSGNIVDQAEDGLLLYVLASANHRDMVGQFAKVDRAVNDKESLLDIPLQAICWMLLGLVKYSEIQKSDPAEKAARKLFRVLNEHYFNKDTLFPYHGLKKYRRRFVSFGGIAYFLKALYEYSRVFQDKYAQIIFKECARKVIDLQGHRGEWAWFYNANSEKIMDWYQVYSVHQDAMAMFFLLPALDMGMDEAQQAIVKSYHWLFGMNELGEHMMLKEPFFIYRSIRRKESHQRAKRYARSIVQSLFHREAVPMSRSKLEINPVCHSYHLGWILYVWAGRRDFEQYTALQLLQ